MQILLNDFHTFSYSKVGSICQKIKAIFPLVIILLILIDFSHDELLLLGEI